MKKYRGFLLSCLMVVSLALLAACGNENAVEGNNEVVPAASVASVEETKEVPVVSASVEEAVPEKELEKMTLKVLDWTADYISPLNEKYCFIKYDGKWYIAYSDNGSIVPDEEFKEYQHNGNSVNFGWDYVIDGMEDNWFSLIDVNEDGTYTTCVLDDSLATIISISNSDTGYVSDHFGDYLEITGNSQKGWLSLKTYTLLCSFNTGDEAFTFISDINSNGVYVAKYRYINSGEYKNENWDIDRADSMTVTITDDFFVKSYSKDGASISFNNCSVSKNGWVSACALECGDDNIYRPKKDEEGNVIGYFFNVYTNELIEEPDTAITGCAYVYTADGLTDAIAIGDYVAPQVRVDAEGNAIYKIYNLATKSFADDTEYSNLILSENAGSIGITTDNKCVYLDENMIPMSGEYDDCTAFMGSYAIVTLDGQHYIIDREFNIVSDALDEYEIGNPSRHSKVSNCLPEGLFRVKDDSGLYHLAYVVKAE